MYQKAVLRFVLAMVFMMGGGLVCLTDQVVLARSQGKPASKAELKEISKRGKDLYTWDQAQMQAIKNLREMPKENLKADNANIEVAHSPSCLVSFEKNKIETAFGRLSGDETYLIDFLAVKTSQEKSCKIERQSPPLADQNKWLDKALALDIARAELKENGRNVDKLNYAVLPDLNDKKGKTFFVYFYPSQKENLGGDIRLKVSLEEKAVLEEHQGHKSLIKEKRLATKYGGRRMAYHQAILDEMPEDTDVLHVLSREPRRAEIVTTANYVYRIEISGEIKYLGTISEMRKKGEKLEN